MGKDSDYIDIKGAFEAMRKNKHKLFESEYSDEDAVPYTQQDELFKTSTETARQQFGADFSQSKNPMLYYPKDKDVVLSGVVPGLNELKFQFRLRDSSGNGCYIWVNSIQLTPENLKTLNLIYGVYDNWKRELLVSQDIKPISFKND